MNRVSIVGVLGVVGLPLVSGCTSGCGEEFEGSGSPDAERLVERLYETLWR
ncbi:MAG: hypothetical protein ACOZNI_13295 [Myxococcota bacterium]